MTNQTLVIEFCGEPYEVAPDQTFTLGREGDLVIDDSPFLHRRLLVFRHLDGLWWMKNVGASTSVSVAAANGSYQAVLGPEAQMPLVFPELTVLFTAGPYSYEFTVLNPSATFQSVVTESADLSVTGGTIGSPEFTPSQFLLLVALCEPILRDGMMGTSKLPTSNEAAERLGWPITTFNRKLDNVCDKLDRAGVVGLRGGPGNLARNRRVRLVEYATLARLVTSEHLPLLETVRQGGSREAQTDD